MLTKSDRELVRTTRNMISYLEGELMSYKHQLNVLQNECSHGGEIKTSYPPICGICYKTLDKQMCMECDGCGWYEGGVNLMTTCEACKGTGLI